MVSNRVCNKLLSLHTGDGEQVQPPATARQPATPITAAEAKVRPSDVQSNSNLVLNLLARAECRTMATGESPTFSSNFTLIKRGSSLIYRTSKI